MTIRRRLIIGLTATFLIVLVLSGLLTVTLVRSRLIGEVDDDLERRRSDIASLRDQGLLPEGAPDADARVRPPGPGGGGSPLPPRNDMAILLLDSEGVVVFSFASGSGDDLDSLPDVSSLDVAALSGDISTVDAIDGSLVYRTVGVSAGDLGTVVLAAPLTGVEEAVRAVAAIATIVAASVVAITAWLVVRSGLKPIDDMVSTADDIAAGDLTSRVPITQPNTEVGHLAVALNSMLGQIETAVDAKTESEDRMRRFVSDASHELRTPLTSIRGYAELYRRGARDEAQVALAFDRIESEATRMGGLVEDLLALARLDQTPRLSLISTDLVALVTEVVGDARAAEPERSITVNSVSKTVATPVDPDRVRQAVSNLLANVRAHTPPGSAVVVEVAGEEKCATISVSDTGPGLDSDIVGQVFDRFYQADSARSGTGSRLGLAIVQAIAEAHGGEARIESAPGSGITVTLSFPR